MDLDIRQYELQEEDADSLSDFSILHSKIREKFFELGLKRKLLDESRTALEKLDSEKHILIQKVDKAERQLLDVNIHLQVAIKAAREAEAERSTSRELMARQGAQLEATSKEREYLQKANRTVEIEIKQIKRELEEAKARMMSQSHFVDLIKKKNTQNNTAFETLTGELSKLEKSFTNLRDLCAVVTQVTKLVNTILNKQKLDIIELTKEKQILEEKVISLTVQQAEVEKATSGNQLNGLQQKDDFLHEWKQNHEEMQKRLQSSEEENHLLQTSLDNAFLTIKKLQDSENHLADKIRYLEEELIKQKGNNGSVVEKETQTIEQDSPKDPSINPS